VSDQNTARVAFVVLLTAASGLLANMLAPVIDSQLGLTKQPFLSVTLAAFIGVLLVSVLLASGVPTPGAFWFQRWRYLTTLSHSSRLTPWSTRFAPLHVRRGRPNYIAAEVLSQGERRDLVQFVLERVFTDPARARTILILGEPGCGKTTAIERLTLELAKKRRWAFGFGGFVPDPGSSRRSSGPG
jgi:hypothetical protein